MPDLLFTSGIDGRNEPDSEEADLPDAPAELAGDLKNQKRMLEWIAIIWFFMPGTKRLRVRHERVPPQEGPAPRKSRPEKVPL